MKDVDLVVSLIALNGGKLVGKTRLQKVVYLLDRCGLGSGFEFEYHNFGPFSAELARAADFASLGRRIKVVERPGFHQVPYSVFCTNEAPNEKVGNLVAEKARRLLNIMEKYSAIELELAATIAYLKESGTPDEKAYDSVKVLKPLKATRERIARAHQLLNELGLGV